MPAQAHSSAQARPTRLERLGLRTLTCAHVLLEEHPEVAECATQALALAESAWKGLLPEPVVVRSRLLEASFLPEKGLALQSAYAVFELSTTGARAVLELDLPLVAGILEVFSGERDTAHAVFELTRGEQAALAYLLLVGLSAARHEDLCQGLWSPRLLGVHSGRRDAIEQLTPGQHVGWDLSIQVGSLRGSARLLAPARAIQSVLARLPRRESGSAAPEVLAAQLSFWPRLGSTLLEGRAAARLTPGDVALLDGLTWKDHAASGEGRLVGPRFALEGAFSASGFTFQRTRLVTPRKDIFVHSSDRTLIQHPARLPVEVEVELARLQLSLGTLSDLKPGMVLPLHVRPGEPVLLRLGDRAVARAELVDVEGEVGARILTMLSEQ